MGFWQKNYRAFARIRPDNQWVPCFAVCLLCTELLNFTYYAHRLVLSSIRSSLFFIMFCFIFSILFCIIFCILLLSFSFPLDLERHVIWTALNSQNKNWPCGQRTASGLVMRYNNRHYHLSLGQRGTENDIFHWTYFQRYSICVASELSASELMLLFSAEH